MNCKHCFPKKWIQTIGETIAIDRRAQRTILRNFAHKNLNSAHSPRQLVHLTNNAKTAKRETDEWHRRWPRHNVSPTTALQGWRSRPSAYESLRRGVGQNSAGHLRSLLNVLKACAVSWHATLTNLLLASCVFGFVLLSQIMKETTMYI